VGAPGRTQDGTYGFTADEALDVTVELGAVFSCSACFFLGVDVGDYLRGNAPTRRPHRRSTQMVANVTDREGF